MTGETVMWVGHASVVPHLDPLMRIEAVQPRSLDTHEALERRIFGIGADQAERRRDALAEALETGACAPGSSGSATSRWPWRGCHRATARPACRASASIEERRGQGYGTLITTIATRAAMATGNRLVWLSVREDNDAAVSVYSSLGFARAFSWTRWLADGGPAPPLMRDAPAGVSSAG